MKPTTPEEIKASLFMQKSWGRSYNDDRRLLVTLTDGDYGSPTSALIEVEGSPPKGLAVLRAETGSLDNPPYRMVDGWVLQSRGEMLKLRRNSLMLQALIGIAQTVVSQHSREGGPGLCRSSAQTARIVTREI